MIGECRFQLPPFCFFTPEEWREKGHEYDEIRDNMLGWDITDFGRDNFEKIGFSLITLRNGNVKLPKYKKTYAEKLLYLTEQQIALTHFHSYKMEDIINRGGGNVFIQVYNSTPDGGLAQTDVVISCDGKQCVVPAGEKIKLTPGESVTIPQYVYHNFAVEQGSGPVLLGEVSMCNDDHTDNRFYEEVSRFPQIEEDEPPYRLLCGEYPKAP